MSTGNFLLYGVVLLVAGIALLIGPRLLLGRLRRTRAPRPPRASGSLN
jgi:hypothetical protein